MPARIPASQLPATCAACGAPIEWHTLFSDRQPIAIDPVPSARGRYAVHRGVATFFAGGVPAGEPGERHNAHAATCAKAIRWGAA